MPASTLSRLQPRFFASASGRLRRAAALAAVLPALACGGDVESRMAEVRALQDVGQFNASIDELREILAVAPDLPEATYRLGVALVQTSEPSRAVWALAAAGLARLPGPAARRLLSGMILFGLLTLAGQILLGGNGGITGLRGPGEIATRAATSAVTASAMPSTLR